MANTDKYSQFADFDPDNLRTTESISTESNSHQNEDESAPVWDRNKCNRSGGAPAAHHPTPQEKFERQYSSKLGVS